MKTKTLIYKQEDGIEHQIKIKHIMGGSKTPNNKILLMIKISKNKDMDLWCQHFHIKE